VKKTTEKKKYSCTFALLALFSFSFFESLSCEKILLCHSAILLSLHSVKKYYYAWGWYLAQTKNLVNFLFSLILGFLSVAVIWQMAEMADGR